MAPPSCLSRHPTNEHSGSEDSFVPVHAAAERIDILTTDSQHVHIHGLGDKKFDDSFGDLEKREIQNGGDSTDEEAQKEQESDGDMFSRTVENGTKFNTMSWWHAGLVMIAETISLGILSLPSVLAEIGLVPGLIIIVGLGICAGYTGYLLGRFKERHPHVHNMADAGFVLFGKWGREIFGAGQLLFLIFVMASHVLTFAIMMNVTTSHATCTIVFMVLGAVVSFICTIPKTLKCMSYLSLASFISVVAAVTVVMVSVGMDNNPIGPVQATRATSLYRAFTGVTNIAFAYAGHLTFFGFISEMKNPKDFNKALAFLQISDTSLYVIAAVVIYKYVGYGVHSPALTSAAPLYSIIAYAIATPTIVISGVINGHVAAKYIFLRVLGPKSTLLAERTVKSWGLWIGCIAVLWFIAWIIAESIPVFNNLLGLIASLFVSWFTFGANSMFWFHMNKGMWWKGIKNKILTVINFGIIIMSAIITVLGLYASGMGLASDAKGQVFSCANNA